MDKKHDLKTKIKYTKLSIWGGECRDGSVGKVLAKQKWGSEFRFLASSKSQVCWHITVSPALKGA